MQRGRVEHPKQGNMDKHWWRKFHCHVMTLRWYCLSERHFCEYVIPHISRLYQTDKAPEKENLNNIFLFYLGKRPKQ